MGKVITGRHAVIDAYFLPYDLCNDGKQLMSLIRETAEVSRSEIVGEAYYEFSPHGASGVVLISESHISFHSYPEYGGIHFDLYTCGTEENFKKALAYLLNWITANDGTAKVSVVERTLEVEVNDG